MGFPELIIFCHDQSRGLHPDFGFSPNNQICSFQTCKMNEGPYMNVPNIDNKQKAEVQAVERDYLQRPCII